MSFSTSATIFDILMTIKDKQPEEINLDDYGLFRPNNDKFDMGVWLQPAHTIESYDLVTDNKIWFRRKQNVVDVLFPDGTKKKMMLDVCQSVKGLIFAIAQKMSLTHPEAFGLQVAGRKQFLRMKACLYEVASPTDVITLQKRHFISTGELNREDPWLLHYTYVQAHDNIVAGLYPCNRQEIVAFGALNAFIELGECDEKRELKSLKTRLHEFVPKQFQTKEVEKEVFTKWKNLASMSLIDAKYQYLQRCMTLRLYGMNVYVGGIEPKGAPPVGEGKKRKLISVLMAFSPTNLKLMSMDYKDLVNEPYEHLKSWRYSSEAVQFDFDKYNNGEIVTFYTPEGEDIYSLVAGYNEIISLKAQKLIQEDKDIKKADEVEITKKRKNVVVKNTTVKTRIVAQPVLSAETAQTSTYADVYQANANYALPVNFAVDVTEKSSNYDNWRNQLRTQSDNLLGLLKPLAESLRGSSKLTNDQIKQFGFFIDGIRDAVLKGANSCEDRDVLEAMSNNLMDALREFMDACRAVEKDPNNPELLRALEETQKRVEMCTQALLACSNGLVMDLNQDVLFELGQALATSIEDATAIADKEQCAAEIAELQSDGRMIVYGSQSMGLATNNSECVNLFNDLLANCKNAAVALREKSSLPDPSEQERLGRQVDEITEQCDFMQSFLAQANDDEISQRKRFIDSCGNALQTTDWLSGLKNVRIEDVQKSSLVLKKDIPLMVKYLKDFSALPEVDDAKRTFIVSNLKDLTTNAKVILTNADQAKYTPDNNDDIREAAFTCSECIRAVLAEDITEVVHHAMYSDTKKAVAASCKVIAQLKKAARSTKNARIRDQLLNAARALNDTIHSLLERPENDTETAFMERAIATAEEYKAHDAQFMEVVDQMEEGRTDVIEEKMTLDMLMDKVQQDVATYKREDMLFGLHNAALDYRISAAELKREMLAIEAASELETSGIREELIEECNDALKEFIEARAVLQEITPFDTATKEKVEKTAAASKRVLKAVVKASRTSKKKNERKMLLDAALKLSNELSRMLDTVDDKAVAPGATKPLTIADLELQAAEKQLMNILKIDDFVEISTSTAEVTSEEITREDTASEKLRDITEQVTKIHQQMTEEVASKKEAAEKSGEPKAIMQAALQEAVVAMVGSSVGVLQNASQAQAELVTLLKNPQTAQSVHRDQEYVDDLVKAVEEVLGTAQELQQKVGDDSVNSDELVKVADKVGKKVERVVVTVRAGTKSKTRSNRYRDLLDAAKKLADATSTLMDAAKNVEDFDDTPIVVAPAQPVITLPELEPLPEIKEEDDIETFGIDEYTLREIEQQKKIFEIERRLEAARKRKGELEEQMTNFQ